MRAAPFALLLYIVVIDVQVFGRKAVDGASFGIRDGGWCDY